VTVLQEIKQRKPFPTKEQEATVTLLRTADVVRRIVGVTVEQHGITVQQYNVLRILRGAGRAGLPTLEIAQRMIEQTPGITRLIDRLQTKKLVERERGSNDRRCVYCRITSAGMTLLGGLDEPVRAATDAAFRGVSKRELANLVESLDRLRETIHRQKTKED
jgi:MarR family transcriptional regulator, organic hydroperoxide resistance regulator